MTKLRELKMRYVRTRRDNPFAGQSLHHPEEVHRLFRAMNLSDKEQLISLHLNIRMEVNCYEVVSIGSADSCIFSPRDILKGVLLSNSCAFILIHNHPSGNPEPSDADLEAMTQIDKAAPLLGLTLLDYMVIGDGIFWSRAENCRENYVGK